MRNATSVKELNRHSGRNPLPGVYSHREHLFFYRLFEPITDLPSWRSTLHGFRKAGR